MGTFLMSFPGDIIKEFQQGVDSAVSKILALREGWPGPSIGADKKYDPVPLDFAKDFKMPDPSAYTLRSELVLNGKR